MNELLVAAESQDKASFNKIPYSFYLSGTRDYLLFPEGPYMAAEARGYLQSRLFRVAFFTYQLLISC